MQDHEIRELVNTLTSIAVTYSGTGQLREHISRAVKDALNPRFTDGIDPHMSNAACLREINEALGGMDITMFSQVATGIHDVMSGYEEAADDKRRLVRELDVLLNGENAAQQASLCDIVAQVRHQQRLLTREATPEDSPYPATVAGGSHLANAWAEGWNARNAAAREDVPDLVQGMEVSIDVSTCDEDAGHRLFGTVTELSELEGAKNGYILLVQDAEKNFTAPPAPAAPAAPDDLIMQVRRLVHALKKANPDHALVKSVPDYMRRAGYWKVTDCLRGSPAEADEMALAFRHSLSLRAAMLNGGDDDA